MSKTLTLTIFAKTRKTKDGREFKTYFTTLPNGEKVKAKFQRDCGEPKQFPCNIDLMQGGCNLSSEKYTRTVEDNKIDPAQQTIAYRIKPHKLFIFDSENEERIPFEVK